MASDKRADKRIVSVGSRIVAVKCPNCNRMMSTKSFLAHTPCKGNAA
jgi:hypothetical protein